MQRPGTTKALLSIVKASTMRLSNAYDEAIRLDPNLPMAGATKAALYIQGKYDEAIKADDKPSVSIPKMDIHGSAKAWLSITKASMMKPSRLTMKLSS